MLESLETRILGTIHAGGPMGFDEFVEQALYDVNAGFYAKHGSAGGRRGDFITSVEVGPLFAAVIADWLDGIWHASGEPHEFRITEVGAGVGTLFRGITRAQPRCADALIYTLVERSASMRVQHQSLPGDGWRSAAAAPDQDQHVVMANELLDNLAFGIAERVGAGWAPVMVGAHQDQLRLIVGDVDDGLADLNALAPQAKVGARVPVASAATEWVTQMRALADHVLAFDYAASTTELAERDQTGWLRTYAAHGRGNDPLVEVGARDITHDVPIDQLPRARVSTQAEWLEAHGISARVEAARQTWQERGHVGDLAAMVARSAIGEAEALTDLTGLGGFYVFEW